jgi:hypothetical protein
MQAYAHAYRTRDARGDELIDTMIGAARAKPVQQVETVVPIAAAEGTHTGS